jgi:hypothetical protein
MGPHVTPDQNLQPFLHHLAAAAGTMTVLMIIAHLDFRAIDTATNIFPW